MAPRASPTIAAGGCIAEAAGVGHRQSAQLRERETRQATVRSYWVSGSFARASEQNSSGGSDGTQAAGGFLVARDAPRHLDRLIDHQNWRDFADYSDITLSDY